MKELLLYIARNLVDDPEAVSVTEVEGPQELTLEPRVAPRRHGKGHRPAGPHRQGDPDCHPVLCPAHRPEGFRRYCRLNRSSGGPLPPDPKGGGQASSFFDHFAAAVRGCGPAASASPFHCLLVLHRKRQVTPPVDWRLLVSTEKKKKFIIDVTYLALILVLSYLLLQYAPPLLPPFVLAFLIAYVLRRPIRFLSRVLHAPKGLVAVLLVVLTYGTIGLLLALAGIRITATITSVVQQIPSLYSAYILPELTDFFRLAGGAAGQAGPLPHVRVAGAAVPAAQYAVAVGLQSLRRIGGRCVHGHLFRHLPARLPDPAAADGDFHILHRRRLPEDRAVLPGRLQGSTRNLVPRSRRMWWERCSSASAPTPSSCPSPLWNYPSV